MVKNGTKKLEGRPKGARLNVRTKEGDVVEFWTGSNGQDYSTKVDGIPVKIGKHLPFESIEDMFLEVGYKNLLPDATSWEDAVETYSKLRVASGYEANGDMVVTELFCLRVSTIQSS
jgi:ASC-1-like (ASCH) protein